MSTSIKCNAREIVAVFGGRANMTRRINSLSVYNRITCKAVDKWCERRSIPSHQMDKIIALAAMSGEKTEAFVRSCIID